MKVTQRFTRLAAGVSLTLLLAVPLSAQYSGMGGSTGGSTGGTTSGSPSYGSNGKAIGIGVGAAAAAVGAVYLVKHHHGPVQGCVTAANDRLTVLDEKTGNTYSIHAGSDDIRPGERFELKGKRSTDTAGASILEVKSAKDLGACH